MEIFRNWLLSVCGATILISIVKIFLDKTSVKKALDTFLAIFMIFYSVMPLTDFEYESIDFNECVNSSEDYTVEGYNKIIYKSIEKICSENGTDVLDYTIDSYIDDEGYVRVKSIVINIDSEDKVALIESEIKEKTDFEVRVE